MLRACAVGVVWSVWPVGVGCAGWRVGGWVYGVGCVVCVCGAVRPCCVACVGGLVCAVCMYSLACRGCACGLACRGWVCRVGHRGGVVCTYSMVCVVLWVGVCLIGHRYGVCWGVGGGYGWVWLTGWLVWLPPGWLRLLDIVLHLTVAGMARKGGRQWRG